MPLRRFLYRNDGTVDDFLGQLELGLLEDQVQKEGKQRGGTAGVKIPYVELRGDRGSTAEVESNVRQTGASKFERLFRLLKTDDSAGLWDLDAVDPETWECLDRGSLVNLEVSINIPAVTRALNSVHDVAPLMEAMSSLDAATVDDQTRAIIATVSKFATASASGEVTVTATAEASPRYRFVCKLERPDLLVPLDKLEGSAYMFGQIQEIIPEGDTETVVDIPAMATLNRAQRREMARQNRSQEADDTTITGPGAIVHVIAIYR